MKNAIKAFGIIAFVAVIGFSMVGYGGDDDGGGYNGPLVGKWNESQETADSVVAVAVADKLYSFGDFLNLPDNKKADAVIDSFIIE